MAGGVSGTSPGASRNKKSLFPLQVFWLQLCRSNQKNGPEGIASLRQVLYVNDLTAFRAELETAMMALKLPER